jgi:hypothetical protein
MTPVSRHLERAVVTQATAACAKLDCQDVVIYDVGSVEDARAFPARSRNRVPRPAVVSTARTTSVRQRQR